MSQPTFADTGLDPRLLRALAKRGFTRPTPVQLEAIPKTLEGKDIVARARTGSGKTLAYLLPALHRLLTAGDGKGGSFQALILVPTRELCEQVKQEAQEVAAHCGSDISVGGLASDMHLVTSLLAESGMPLRRAVSGAGHLVVSTPGKVAAALKDGALPTVVLEQRLQVLVLDEADLLLSYGYEADLELLAPHVPRSCQCLLMSATVSEGVERLTRLVLHNPVTLNLLQVSGLQGPGTPAAEGGASADGELGGGSGVSSTVEHYSLTLPNLTDKLLALMATLKLGLVRKRVLVFVNTVDQGFRAKLFLESFGIRAALLNAELPLNSRSHILASFNKGMFDYLIATDDVHAQAHDAGAVSSKKRKRDAAGKQQRGKKGGPAKDEEFGVTRGIDFKGVRTIINFDLPSSVQGYVHRVGRTGRAGQEGLALTFLTPDDFLFESEVKSLLSKDNQQQPEAAADGKRAKRRKGAAGKGIADGQGGEGDDDEDGREGVVSGSESESEDEELFAPSVALSDTKQKGLQPFTALSKAQMESLRYRAEDIGRSLTKNVIKEARAREIRAELLNSEKLKEYFEEHAAERALLRHDKALHKTPQAAHLKHLPGYLKDPRLVTATATGNKAPSALDARKKRKLPKPKEAHITGTAVTGTGAAGDATAAGAAGQKKGEKKGPKVDPLKGISVKGFAKAPRKGSHADEELTEMEKRAMEAGLKEAKKKARAQGLNPAVVLNKKSNVRKFKRHR